MIYKEELHRNDIENVIKRLFGDIVKGIIICDPYDEDDKVLYEDTSPGDVDYDEDSLSIERIIITVEFINGKTVCFYGNDFYMYAKSTCEDIF